LPYDFLLFVFLEVDFFLAVFFFFTGAQDPFVKGFFPGTGSYPGQQGFFLFFSFEVDFFFVWATVEISYRTFYQFIDRACRPNFTYF
jgi:hypothetical protein